MTFSVVVPLHNKAPHVQRSLVSVLSQTLVDWELIVIDDASTDGGGQVAADMLVGEPRARILRRGIPGAGGYAARNLGAREAKAGWVAFLDADDEWKPGILAEFQRLMSLFQGVGFLATAHLDRFPSGSLRADSYAAASGLSNVRQIDLLDYARSGAAGHNPIHTSAVAARRDLLLAAGGFPENRCIRGGDRDTWLRLLEKSDLAWSSYIGATYYRDAVNMVTMTTPLTISNCMDMTFSRMIADRGLVERFGRGARRAFMRLSNYEKKGAIRHKIRAGDLRLADIQSLYVLAEPLYALRVFLSTLLPRAFLRSFYRRREEKIRKARAAVE
jgi:succinoglycan biosynthesis protein ExoO